MRIRTIIASLFLLVLACSSTAPLAATAPAVPRRTPSAAQFSIIMIPIRASLAPLLPEIESRVANKFNNTAHERGIDVRYEVARDPLQLRMVGAGLHSNTTVRYALEACRGKFPCVSCGFKEARREADITLHTKLEWDPSWRLRSTTTLLPVNYAIPCEVTWLNIDVTKRFVAPVVEQQLNAAAKIIDKNTPALATIRPYAEQVWTSLQTPVELAPRTWLVLEPSEVGLAPITGSGLIVTTTLGLRALTRIVVGDKPVVTRKPLRRSSISRPARRRRRARPVRPRAPVRRRHPLHLRRGRGQDLPDRRQAADDRLDPARAGIERQGPDRSDDRLSRRPPAQLQRQDLLEGTPRFDTATSMIVIPDLDYSLDPKRRGFLARIAERAAHDTIRTRLRNSARFPLAPRLNTMREEITRALTRDLARGVTLRGRADTLQPISVTPLANVLLIRMLAIGRAEVGVGE
jgi:hypothetical protein